ncbi:hypothetical protein N8508_00060 [bacterium]|nr:hypothetical protein [bacterium]
MGQKNIFDGKLYTEPVAKSKIISGVSNTGAPSSFGNICIIDTGLGATYGGGKGAIDSGANGIQLNEFLAEFNSASEMKNFVKGGVLWDLADYIYTPSLSSAGASTVYLARAAQTAQAQNTSAFDGAFSMVLNTLEEGINANGVLEGTDLKVGYGWSISAGVLDAAKYVFKFYRGTYRGVDTNGFLFDGQDAATAAAAPQLVAESAEVASLEELIAWSATSPEFTNLFEFDATSATTGTFAAADLATFAAFQLFTGGTETYNSTALDHVLDQIKELDNSFFLALDSGSDAAGTNNVKILSHIVNDAEFKKFVIIGGGDVDSDFATTKTSAGTLNSRYASLVHGGIEVPYILNSAQMIKKSALYKAALYLGRASGVEPQVPLTYKDLRIQKEQHVMTESQRVDAINSGVVATRFVPQLGIVVNQQVNTLQLNDFLINPDGSSPELSVERIEAQLNREISSNARVLFIGNNLASASQAVVESFTIGYLLSKVAEVGVSDNLILDFQNVKAERVGTSWFVTYDFQANTPINKIFHTGTIIDPSI